MAKQNQEKIKIYSMASNDFVLPTYEKQEAGVQSSNVIKSAIVIKGGANVAHSASNKHERNPKFGMTEMTAEELETLKNHAGFMRRVKRGFITIDDLPKELKADKSAQMTEKQLNAKAPNAKPRLATAEE